MTGTPVGHVTLRRIRRRIHVVSAQDLIMQDLHHHGSFTIKESQICMAFPLIVMMYIIAPTGVLQPLC
jgi:hypothetical protein